jgi:acyl carrier protein
MPARSIEYEISELIVQQLKMKLPNADPASFDPDLDLIDGLRIDSIDMAAVALRIQDRFSVVVGESDYEGFKTIRAIADFVRRSTANQMSVAG